MTHGGGREAGHGGHFFAPFAGLVRVVAVAVAGRRRLGLGLRAGLELAHRRPVEREPIGVVDDAIEDGVGEGGLADDLVPRCRPGAGW